MGRHIVAMNRHAALIDKLGGSAHLASVLGIQAETTKKWPARGIPARHWHKIVALSPGLTAAWLEKTKPIGVQSRLNGKRKRRR
jgi:hypothetical protein